MSYHEIKFDNVLPFLFDILMSASEQKITKITFWQKFQSPKTANFSLIKIKPVHPQNRTPTNVFLLQVAY